VSRSKQRKIILLFTVRVSTDISLIQIRHRGKFVFYLPVYLAKPLQLYRRSAQSSESTQDPLFHQELP
jgi:hypothetical protein